MSSKNIHKRRCIVQKLDFENCIVTSIKTTTRGRKKLRARITREIERFSDLQQEMQAGENLLNASPVLTQKTDAQAAEPSSPVLIKKQRRDSSPIFFKRKKPSSHQKRAKKLSECSIIEEVSSSPGSPVFKTFKKPKFENVSLNKSQDIEKVLGKMTNLDMFNSQGNSSSLPIEDFTQESSESIKISSVDSTSAKKNSSSNYSIERNDGSLSRFCRYNSVDLSKICTLEKHDSLKSVKRNYKKNSLLARLHKLKQKQASEKLLWQHQNRRNSSRGLKVSVINFWKQEFSYFLKCQSDLENMFLIVDSRWVPTVKKIKEGSVLQLHPPWQKLSAEETMITVLLNVICIEILNETEEPIVQKKTFESVPVDRFEIDKKLFMDSLFSPCKSCILY